MSFDVHAIRSQFPILARQVHGKPLAYLDNAASAQKPQAVLDALSGQAARAYANVHRGVHTLANETTEAYEQARAKVARFVNAPNPEQIVFAKGATHAINIVANGIADQIKPGDEIVLTVMEHHSNIVPWHFLRERHGAVLRFVDIDEDGRIDPAAFAQAFSVRTKLAAFTHMSNVLGVKTDARALVQIAHDHGALALVDGCQAVVHGPVDVQALDCDFYAFSGHKLYGPTGIGVLYGKADALERLRPFEGGGEMIETVSLEAITYNTPPHRFEAGTPAILEAVALGAALDWFEGLDRAAVHAHEAALAAALTERLKTLNSVRLYGEAEGKGAIVAFNLEGAHPHDVAQIADRYGVAIRAGHHCCQPLMKRLGVSATARASFGLYNTLEEVDALVEALIKARAMLT
jgi:cysteine desulfurase / selenocysteine lyase